MPLNEITELRGDYVFWGRKNFEELSGNNRIDIYELIQSDIEAYFEPPERDAATVIFTPLIEIVAFNPNIVQTYGGFPPRSRFGEYAFYNADASYEHRFLTYEKQQLRRGRSYIVNGEDSPLTVFVPEPTTILTNTWIQLLSSTFSNPDAPICTGIEFQLNQSVIANVSILYGGQMVFYFDGSFFPLQTYVNV
jgi:hypothetical protein